MLLCICVYVMVYIYPLINENIKLKVFIENIMKLFELN